MPLTVVIPRHSVSFVLGDVCSSQCCVDPLPHSPGAACSEDCLDMSITTDSFLLLLCDAALLGAIVRDDIVGQDLGLDGGPGGGFFVLAALAYVLITSWDILRLIYIAEKNN
jgi:hypothetical protein